MTLKATDGLHLIISAFIPLDRGLETVLREELMSPVIGATLVKSSGRGCHFRGDVEVGYKAILWLRTAHRWNWSSQRLLVKQRD